LVFLPQEGRPGLLSDVPSGLDPRSAVSLFSSRKVASSSSHSIHSTQLLRKAIVGLIRDARREIRGDKGPLQNR